MLFIVKKSDRNAERIPKAATSKRKDESPAIYEGANSASITPLNHWGLLSLRRAA
jgi:hypothetical protein